MAESRHFQAIRQTQKGHQTMRLWLFAMIQLPAWDCVSVPMAAR